ncbi:nuclear transport factor 2 family protein [uncultured Paraglaciecola sp.]|uniref:nuclear transport factor 2 family protein n=1 Tax=uncultured Paraglaciecola sp. TaxID=1765024 RepID=UPI0030DBA82C|tara:strand:- start:493588 stop:494061 length:474 start_codon:yes stop_codon:yes gene_type:complete
MLQRKVCLLLVVLLQLPVQANQTQIVKVLDNFHQAASDANHQEYFDLLTDTAVFIGTDGNERWDKNAFEAFAKPYFEQGKGWTYIPRNRHVTVAKSGDFAWFDEMLDSQSYGECRGTGVLELTDKGWQISQYHLTIPVPNELAKEVVQQIKQLASKK